MSMTAFSSERSKFVAKSSPNTRLHLSEVLKEIESELKEDA